MLGGRAFISFSESSLFKSVHSVLIGERIQEEHLFLFQNEIYFPHCTHPHCPSPCGLCSRFDNSPFFLAVTSKSERKV